MLLTKYHGLGNDFIIGSYQDLSQYNFSELALKLCNRNTGFGADGLIVVKENPLEMIYYNSDGSRAAMCGNGIRCFANYVYDQGINKEASYDVITLAGVMNIEVMKTTPFEVKVNMGTPDFTPSSIPALSEEKLLNHNVMNEDINIVFDSLLLGVPHTVVNVDCLNDEEMIHTGSFFNQLDLFPEGTNVNFYTYSSRTQINMQTYERGAGLTLACGTGACAVFASLRKKALVESVITVSLPLGDLMLEERNGSIFMSGPAEKIGDLEWN